VPPPSIYSPKLREKQAGRAALAPDPSGCAEQPAMPPASCWEWDATGAGAERTPRISQAAVSLVAFFAIPAVPRLCVLAVAAIDFDEVEGISSAAWAPGIHWLHSRVNSWLHCLRSLLLAERMSCSVEWDADRDGMHREFSLKPLAPDTHDQAAAQRCSPSISPL
jgi:hypothetical protein